MTKGIHCSSNVCEYYDDVKIFTMSILSHRTNMLLNRKDYNNWDLL